MLIPIDNDLLDKTTAEAITSTRRRGWFLFHDLTENFHRMLNAIEPDSYVMPHKHEAPDKAEVFIALRGRAAIASFDENGIVLQCVIIEAGSSMMGSEIEARTWHSVLSLEPHTVLYEVLEGPYVKANHKTFAHDWAPPENDSIAGVTWLREKLAPYLDSATTLVKYS